MRRARLAAPLIIACAALVISMLAAGCGTSSAGAVAPLNAVKAIAPSINAPLGIPNSGVVVDNAMITYKVGSLQGVLPSVKPIVLTRGNKDLKRVALTIDDGWSEDPRILKLLKQQKVKFTAFLIGGRGVANDNPSFVKRIVEAGGEVCSHTWSHYVMRGKSEDFVMSELWNGQGAVTKVTHEVLPYVRFSGGAYDKPALDWTAQSGYYVVNWTLDTMDSTANPNVPAQVSAVMNGISNGAIILCHWGGHNTYDVLSQIIPQIRAKGYEITSLSRVMEGTPYRLTGTTASEGKKSGK